MERNHYLLLQVGIRSYELRIRSCCRRQFGSFELGVLSFELFYRHYSFWKDIEMIFATVLGFKVKFAGEEV